MTIVRIHASLFDYLERLQKESEGEHVEKIIVSCGGRATRMLPSELRKEMNRLTPRTEWQFIPHTEESA